MALYRFLFAPALLAVAVALGSGPSSPPASAPRAAPAPFAASAPGRAAPVALQGDAVAHPIRAR